MSTSKNLRVTLAFLLIFFAALFFADFSVTTLEPLMELKKFFNGALHVDISNIPTYYERY